MESNQRKAREATEACDAAQKEVAALQKVVKKKEQELVQKDEDFHEQCATPFCFCPLAPVLSLICRPACPWRAPSTGLGTLENCEPPGSVADRRYARAAGC